MRPNRYISWQFSLKAHNHLIAYSAYRRKKTLNKNSGFFRIWSGKGDSNSRPQPWQGYALPTELFPRSLFGFLNKKLNQKILSGKGDSNSRPQPWQGYALPTELFPHGYV